MIRKLDDAKNQNMAIFRGRIFNLYISDDKINLISNIFLESSRPKLSKSVLILYVSIIKKKLFELNHFVDIF